MLYLVVSIFVFVCFICAAYICKNNQTKAITIAFVGTLISTGILVYPLIQEIDEITNIIQTVFYVFDTPSMKGDFDLLANAPQNLYKLYEYTLYLYCVLSPILAVGVIISFIGNLVDEIKVRRKTSKNVHIFSEINEKSVTLAESIDSSDLIVMYDKEDKKEFRERIKNIHGLILKKNIKNMYIKNFLGKINIYEINENEEENLNNTLSFIEKNKDLDRNMEVYVFSMEEEAQVILDSTVKNNVKTTIINEAQQMTYYVLDEVPLYTNAENKKISALVVGSGKIGSEFVKAINWCGQMIDYSLNIHVVDKRANKIKEEIKINNPELLEYYDIHFYEVNVHHQDFYELIRTQFKDVNYIVINLGEDRLNLNTAIYLRKVFLQMDQKPIINVMIENEYKNKQVLTLKNERGTEYELYPYGSIKDLYNVNHIINQKIENLAKGVHLAYSKEDTEFKNYYKIEYNKKSSRASALHIKYKMYSILKDDYNNVSKIKEALQNKEILDYLAQNEHERWNAYVRSDGYKLASIDQVKGYFPKTNHHVYHLAKMHPTLVPWDELDHVSEEISKIKHQEIDFKDADYFIVKAIPEIMERGKKRE